MERLSRARIVNHGGAPRAGVSLEELSCHAGYPCSDGGERVFEGAIEARHVIVVQPDGGGPALGVMGVEEDTTWHPDFFDGASIAI